MLSCRILDTFAAVLWAGADSLACPDARAAADSSGAEIAVGGLSDELGVFDLLTAFLEDQTLRGSCHQAESVGDESSAAAESASREMSSDAVEERPGDACGLSVSTSEA